MRKCKLLLSLCAVISVIVPTKPAAGQDFALLTPPVRQHTTNDHQDLKTVLSSLERRFGVYFAFESQIIHGRYIETEVKITEDLEETLTRVLGPLGLQFKKLSDKFYTIFPAEKERKRKDRTAGDHGVRRMNPDEMKALFRMDNSAPHLDLQFIVSGTVTDENNLPLPGANIIVKGTTNGTTSAADGSYSLSVIDSDAVLVISFIGYTSQEVKVYGRSTINVSLVPTAESLEEVVVTGYSTQRKKDIIGSISVVNAEDLATLNAPSVEQALQGMVSGVNVINSGVPGVGGKIFIRGLTSFGDTEPLVIVDGIQQDLDNISPNDIESIQVLKDAGAAAIYGVRGANGVIVVTTKKGKIGAPVVSYDAFYGVRFPLPGNPYNVLNSQDFMTIYNIGRPGNPLFANGMPDYMYRGPAGSGVGFEGDPAVDPSLYFYEKTNTGRNYIIQKVNKTGEDWFHALFKRAPTMNHSLNIRGGTDKAKYLFAFGYLNQRGTAVNTSLKRYSVRINTEYNLNDWLKVGENANIIYQQNPPMQAGIGSVYLQMPIIPVKDIMGNWGGSFGGPDIGTFTNPVAIQHRDVENDIHNDWHIIGNIYGEATFLRNFTFRSSIGYNINNFYFKNYTATQTENIQVNRSLNRLTISMDYSNMMTFTNTLDFRKTWGKHDVSVLVGSEAIDFTQRGVGGEAAAFFSDDANFLDLDNGTQDVTNESFDTEHSLFSLFARADYSFADKYLFGVTLRRDGSSRFGPEKRFGIFPSVSAGWRLSSEGFMQDVAWVDDLKLRASYGVMGSQNNVSSDNAFSLFSSDVSTTYYDIHGTSNSIVLGFAESRIGNPATGWEENVVTNVGLDASMFDRKLAFSVEYYKKEINGLLFPQPLPETVLGGSTPPTINIGDIQNTGVDAMVNYFGKIGSELNFNVGLNVTSYKNIVVDIPDPGYFDAGSHESIGSMVRNEEGHPVSSFYGYKIIGLFNSAQEVAEAPTQLAAAPGRFRYQDTNADGAIDADDRVHLGSPNPDFTYGLTAGLNFKRFDLSAFFYGSQGNEVYNTTRASLHFFQFYNGQKSNVLKDAWTPENTDTTVPIIQTTQDFSTNRASNSYYIEDGSYLRLRSVVLGYTLNPLALQKVGISQLRAYVQGTNLFTITDYTGLDPEIGGPTPNFGIDFGSYPNNEPSVILGVNLKF